MRMIALLTSLCVLAEASAFTTTGPTYQGTRAIADLPADQHMRNTGGLGRGGPGTGAGLCVFTSVEHGSRWQNVKTLAGFQTWMKSKPGGGYPSKLDAMLTEYCSDKGVPVPAYLQHEGGDVEFLELALKTDRMPCVTYDGRDGFYAGSVAHMVNLAHLDQERAAIIDNNRPGSWVWMTRAEFLSRWRSNNGGWAVVLLDPPPPPYTRPPAQSFEQCPGGVCPRIAPSSSPATSQIADGWHQSGEAWDYHQQGRRLGRLDASGWHDAHGDGWLVATSPMPAGIAPPVEQLPTGVEPGHIRSSHRYTAGGKEISRAAAFASLTSSLADDSGRWHLTIVGTKDFADRVKADIAKIGLADKLLVQHYLQSDWPVVVYSLAEGVSLRAPSPGRVAAEIAAVPSATYSAERLSWLLSQPGGPVPAPTPSPAPVGPEPVPSPTNGHNWLLIAAVAIGTYLLLRK